MSWISVLIPGWVCATLITSFPVAVCLKWKLHFEFITATSPINGLDLETAQPGDRMWQGPGQIRTESMTWDVPVQVLPTMPTQAENIASSQTLSLLQFWRRESPCDALRLQRWCSPPVRMVLRALGRILCWRRSLWWKMTGKTSPWLKIERKSYLDFWPQHPRETFSLRSCRTLNSTLSKAGIQNRTHFLAAYNRLQSSCYWFMGRWGFCTKSCGFLKVVNCTVIVEVFVKLTTKSEQSWSYGINPPVMVITPHHHPPCIKSWRFNHYFSYESVDQVSFTFKHLALRWGFQVFAFLSGKRAHRLTVEIGFYHFGRKSIETTKWNNDLNEATSVEW